MTEAKQIAQWIELQRRLGDRGLAHAIRSGEADNIASADLVDWLCCHFHIHPTPASERVGEELARDKGGCDVISLCDARYPRRIREALGELAPPVFYCRGDMSLFRMATFAIIGTRRPTAAGKQAACTYAQETVRCGWTVVSGNAPGVDAAAHSCALAGRGSTIVFPPAPLDQFKPSFALPSWGRVLVASRFLPGSAITPWCFVARNELVAALCYGALVAETGTRGGTLNTVGHLLRLGRPMFVADLGPSARHRAGFERVHRAGGRPVPALPDPEDWPTQLSSLKKEAKSAAEHVSQNDFFSQGSHA